MQVTENDKIKFNELYYKYHNYSRVARETGFSPSTVKKYIIKDYVPADKIEIKRFRLREFPEPKYDIFKNVENWSTLCALSDEEVEEIRELWKEMSI